MLLPEKWDKVPQPEACASKDASRPALQHVYLRIEETEDGRRGWLEATDSYCLSRLLVEVSEQDTEGFIPSTALVAARKVKATEIEADGSVSFTADGVRQAYDRPDEGQFPNARQFFPDTESEFRFGVDVSLLVKAAKALGTEKIAVSFTAGADGSPQMLRPLVVRRAKGCVDDAAVLVMPHRLDF